MFRVVAMSAWPRICLTTSGGRPLAAILVAAVWRQVCGVTP